jgi:large subunit ribosomal protein L15
MLKLNNLKSPKGAHKNIKRIGRGQGSGQGTQAGKGHKGQKARSGGGVRTGFEGGAMPLYMRLPKRGFSNARFRKVHAEVSLKDLETHVETGVVTPETLIAAGILKGSDRKLPVKLLANGTVTKAFTIENIQTTKSSRQAIEGAGGQVKTIENKG